ncbi:DNA-directed RNA polymerase subunit beta [Gossypium arboreum]|uniref:DNA-directed RNA polymerase subunit beta n=1 Tax=Gossypium arboreum TaxID=29729 RepID=A0A0B0NZ84_GOSAR|nr:DNA-directed RNA polymerase subunit beta [Gossypium arboreum]
MPLSQTGSTMSMSRHGLTRKSQIDDYVPDVVLHEITYRKSYVMTCILTIPIVRTGLFRRCHIIETFSDFLYSTQISIHQNSLTYKQ